MRNNARIVFIDSKGVSHNALVKSFREHRDGNNALVHDEPLVTLTYNLPNGTPQELIDVHHMAHPHKQETNPDLPTYAIHVWKHEDEEHLEVPPDHPIHDHPFAQTKFDDAGNAVPKRRPVHEAHIAEHRARKGASAGAQELPSGIQPLAENVTFNSTRDFVTRPGIEVGHPAHSDTIHFEQNCVSCGKTVRRVASHQGGAQWEKVTLTLENASHDFHPGDKEWQEHVCKQEDIDAYRESLKPKTEPEMSEIQKAALESKPEDVHSETKAAAEAQEVDVVKELEKAPPAPTETENKSEDPA
jgi:hypothetical protein